MQPGDRLLCINDWHTAEGSLEEAQHLLRALSLSGNHSVTLLVEFNVIEVVNASFGNVLLFPFILAGFAARAGQSFCCAIGEAWKLLGHCVPQQ